MLFFFSTNFQTCRLKTPAMGSFILLSSILCFVLLFPALVVSNRLRLNKLLACLSLQGLYYSYLLTTSYFIQHLYKTILRLLALSHFILPLYCKTLSLSTKSYILPQAYSPNFKQNPSCSVLSVLFCYGYKLQFKCAKTKQPT